jgi:hypothetical protein
LLPSSVDRVMLAATAALATVLALVGAGPGTTSTLEQLSPASLHRTGRDARLPDDSLGSAWARRGRLLALVVKPTATGQPIRFVDTRTMRTIRIVPVGDRDICGLVFDGPVLVALAADRPCYWRGGRFSVLRIAPGSARLTSVVKVPGIHTAFPTNLAFGDRIAFVTRAGGGIDAVDLATGRTTPHRPRRSLAKGEGIVATRWLGSHTLGAGPLAVNVRTWRSRRLGVGTRGLAPAGGMIAAYGANGVSVYTRTSRLVFVADRGVPVGDVHVAGRYLYASAGAAIDVFALDTHELIRSVVAPGVWALLTP